MELFDNHAHYDDEKFNVDREYIISEVYKSGVTKLISAGYSLQSSKYAIEIANNNDFIYATCGISPNDIPCTIDEFNVQLNELETLLENKKVVAIGEIGLDYYWNKDNKILQKQAFIAQIELANKYNLPIVIHTRDAIMDTLDILKNIKKAVKPGVFHCCPLNEELVKEALRLGFYISFAGPITFKNSKNANEIINLVPNDRILIETDSPYLSPEPLRGKRNIPANVKFVAQKVADVKEIDFKEIEKITRENAERIFKIN